MAKCKFDRTQKCPYGQDCYGCATFKELGQQRFAPAKPKVVKEIKHKGFTTKIYRVKKK